jgi:hypothetical protein
MSLLVVAQATCIPRCRRTKAGGLRQGVFECTGGVIVVGLRHKMFVLSSFEMRCLPLRMQMQCVGPLRCALPLTTSASLNRLQMKYDIMRELRQSI